MEPKIVTNCNDLAQEDELKDIIFKCCKCKFQSEHEEDLTICDDCGNYVCDACVINKERQGLSESFCSWKCK